MTELVSLRESARVFIDWLSAWEAGVESSPAETTRATAGGSDWDVCVAF